ncbi:MAG: hypothetical protein KC535_02900 [Nanoarchaeota archaeon]|nr:hypothetical protein [Nanoarchaeota archaeon]
MSMINEFQEYLFKGQFYYFFEWQSFNQYGKRPITLDQKGVRPVATKMLEGYFNKGSNKWELKGTAADNLYDCLDNPQPELLSKIIRCYQVAHVGSPKQRVKEFLELESLLSEKNEELYQRLKIRQLCE